MLWVLVAAVWAGCSQGGHQASSSTSVSPAAERAKTQREVERLKEVVRGSEGDAERGKALFAASCQGCHTLNGEGGKIGPNLTHYERSPEHLAFFLHVLVDPGAEIHDYHTTVEVETEDGTKRRGMFVEDDGQTTVLLTEQSGRVEIEKDRIVSTRALMTSLMPDDVVTSMTDQQVVDLFAYLFGDAQTQGAEGG